MDYPVGVASVMGGEKGTRSNATTTYESQRSGARDRNSPCNSDFPGEIISPARLPSHC